MHLSSTHRKQQAKNWFLLAVLVALAAVIFILAFIRVGGAVHAG